MTTTYEYSTAWCSCGGKITAITDAPSGRRIEFDYDALTGLLTAQRELNPSGATAPAVTQWEWVPAVAGDVYGAYRLVATTMPDGKQWSYSYVSVPRHNVAWGVKHQYVTATSTQFFVQGDATLHVLTSTSRFHVNDPVLDGQGRQAAFVGQLTRTEDADGVTTDYTHDGFGRLQQIVRNAGGGGLQVTHGLTLDRFGDLVGLTTNAGSTLEQSLTFQQDGCGQVALVSGTVGGVSIEQRNYYDRWGHLCVSLRTNKASSGAAPDDFGVPPRSDAARAWLRDEFHHYGQRLVMTLRDRRALDRDEQGPIADAADARFLRTDFAWTPDGLLTEVAQPNGASTLLTYDGYGTVYRVRRAAAGQQPITLVREFVNSALEVIQEVRGEDSLLLVTGIERNAAGIVSKIVEPQVSAPVGYPWTPASASHEFTTDVMARTTEARTLFGTTLLTRRSFTYDELGRPVVARVFEGTASTPSQTFTTVWEAASRVKRVTGPAGRFVERDHDALGRVTEVRDSRPTQPNKVLFEYFANTDLLHKVTRRSFDELGSAYVNSETRYTRDSLGRILQIDDGPMGATLQHRFSYYSTGQTETYTDPSGKVEKYLPDALGRLVERFLPSAQPIGAQPIWNGTTYLDWTGTNDRTEMHQQDGRGRLTKTLYDFVGRPFALMEPGAATEPTAASPHQPFARYLSYDAASRLSSIAAGDNVLVHFARDGMGRMIVRKTASAGQPNVSWYHGLDLVKRNALGQVVSTQSYFGPDGTGGLHSVEDFERDALGRTHRESFGYFLAANATDVLSTYNGGDPFRTGVRYANHLTAADGNDLWLDYAPDAVGRTSSIDWRAASAAPPSPLADYLHQGGATRRRTTWLPTNPVSSFDTDYGYDVYGRMQRIDQSFSAQAFVEFHYDAASNLVKEVYKKQGGPTQLGDRFAYDEHHRLQKAWLGSGSMTVSDPDVASYVQRLTYGLDAANNRTSVEMKPGSGSPVTASYSTQDSGEPQGPSNRYDSAEGVVPEYDARGNTIYDGNLFYVYDAMNRLTEVYAVQHGDGFAGGGAQAS
ncbi:MAG: RHS repeat domain-containing protein, partial [Mycobacteriales bacterium]